MPAVRARSTSSSMRSSPVPGATTSVRSTSSVARSSRIASPLASWIASSAGSHLAAPLARQVHRNARLELDDRDGVGQGVVQLPGDPQPLLTGSAQRGLLSVAFGVERPLLGLAEIRLPVLVDESGDPGAEEPAEQQQRPLDGVLRARCGDDQYREVAGEEEGARGDGPRAPSAARRRVHGCQHGERGPAAGVRVHDVPQHGDGGDGEHGARSPPVPGKRQGARCDEQQVECVRSGCGTGRGEDRRPDGDGERRVQQANPPVDVPLHEPDPNSRTTAPSSSCWTGSALLPG